MLGGTEQLCKNTFSSKPKNGTLTKFCVDGDVGGIQASLACLACLMLQKLGLIKTSKSTLKKFRRLNNLLSSNFSIK